MLLSLVSLLVGTHIGTRLASAATCRLDFVFDDVDAGVTGNSAHYFEWTLVGKDREGNFGQLRQGRFLASHHKPLFRATIQPLDAVADAYYVKMRRTQGANLKASFKAQIQCGGDPTVELRFSPDAAAGDVNSVPRNQFIWFHNPQHAARVWLTATLGDCPAAICTEPSYTVHAQLVSKDGKKCRASEEQAITLPNQDEPTVHSLYVSCMRADVAEASRFAANQAVELRLLDEDFKARVNDPRNKQLAAKMNASFGTGLLGRLSGATSKAAAGTADFGVAHKINMYNSQNGIVVKLPNYENNVDKVSDTWVKASTSIIAWKKQNLSKENDMPDYYWAFEEATVLGAATVIDSLPVAFCWKKGGDAGKIPICKDHDWERKGAMCYKKCRSGYKNVLGVCWERCRSGYRDDGATCYKRNSFLNFYGKHSYVTKQANMFSSRAGCESRYYKSGALCYKDCRKLWDAGMVNCGIGACGWSGKSCVKMIADMTKEVFQGIFQGVSFVAGFGGTYRLSKLVKLGATPMGRASPYLVDYAGDAFRNLQEKFMDDAWNKELKGNVKREIKKDLKPKYVEILGVEGMNKVADTVVNEFKSQMRRKKRMAEQFSNTVDPLGIGEMTGLSDMIKTCKDAGKGDVNSNIACADAAMDLIYWFDWTGLSSVASAFLKPICDFD